MKSVLVIGMGRLGRNLAVEMLKLGNEVMVVDERPEIIQSLSEKLPDCHIGDCTNESVLKSLDV